VDKQFRDDFKQDLLLIILEDKTGNVVKAYNNNQVRYYVIRIILNLVNQNRNIYHQQYILPHRFKSDIEDHPEIQARCYEDSEMQVRVLNEKEEEMILQEINNLEESFGTFFYKGLVDLVNEQNGMRKAARVTGIPVSTISRGIKKVREHINKKVS